MRVGLRLVENKPALLWTKSEDLLVKYSKATTVEMQVRHVSENDRYYMARQFQQMRVSTAC